MRRVARPAPGRSPGAQRTAARPTQPRPVHRRSQAAAARAAQRRQLMLRRRRRTLTVALLAVLSMLVWLAWPERTPADAGPAHDGAAAANVSTTTEGARFTAGFLDPSSIEPTVVTEVGPHTIVNRTNALPADWTPQGLVEVTGEADTNRRMYLATDAAAAWEGMRDAAAEDGIDLRLMSAYRSYERQAAIVVREKERGTPEGLVAPAGHSEHQTGLALDLVGMPSFPEPVDANARGQWLVEHAAEHGFILRYPQDKQDETGYRYESWHWRWVGPELARHLSTSGQTMEAWAGLLAP